MRFRKTNKLFTNVVVVEEFTASHKGQFWTKHRGISQGTYVACSCWFCRGWVGNPKECCVMSAGGVPGLTEHTYIDTTLNMFEQYFWNDITNFNVDV